MGIASLPQERWTSKIIEWNLGLDNKIRTNRSVGRPRKRLEDEINEQLMPEETEEAKGNDLRNNNSWKIHAKKKWKAKEEKLAKRDSKKYGEMSQTKSMEVFALTFSIQTFCMFVKAPFQVLSCLFHNKNQEKRVPNLNIVYTTKEIFTVELHYNITDEQMQKDIIKNMNTDASQDRETNAHGRR